MIDALNFLLNNPLGGGGGGGGSVAIAGVGFEEYEVVGSIIKGETRQFSYVVPEGATNLRFTLQMGSGDADLYILYNQPFDPNDPFASHWSSTSGGSTSEIVNLPTPEPGVYNVTIDAYEDVTRVMLRVECDPILAPARSRVLPVVDLGTTVIPETFTHVFVQLPATGDITLRLPPPTQHSVLTIIVDSAATPALAGIGSRIKVNGHNGADVSCSKGTGTSVILPFEMTYTALVMNGVWFVVDADLPF